MDIHEIGWDDSSRSGGLRKTKIIRTYEPNEIKATKRQMMKDRVLP